ncbi:MAG: ribonuclease G [Gammaproteobacteria bacterium]|nr:ribonuclease G [Gammaproteobacteria bacterium]NNK99878.1 ribonuclease G [Xanthomonadales bacterium]
MSEEILINVTPTETRVAVVENGMLQEVSLERNTHLGYLGNIYKGTVSRVLPGMQAAFIDIGLDRTAFLHASDIHRVGIEQTPDDPPPEPPITSLVREGEEVIVQVIKDPLGTKGARLTTNLSIPSRFLVLLPDSETIAVSVRIEDENERNRLKSLVATLREHKGKHGYIVRTNAENINDFALSADMSYLEKIWESITQHIQVSKPGECIYEDLALPLRALRDHMHEEVEKVRIDSLEEYARLKDFTGKFLPEWEQRIESYSAERPVFDLYGIEDEIDNALHRTTPLKSGGHLVIDQTEAMTTIDVNTGGFVGHRTLEETIYKTNLEAVQSIARQLRLRNLGGIIIIDFIDMANEEHRRQVMLALERALERDHAKTNVCEISALGLVEMTRKRTTESLGHVLCEPCPMCSGRGEIKSAETVCLEVFREILRSSRQFEASRLLVVASSVVVDKILDDQSTTVAELEEVVGKSIRFQREDQYTQEQFDVVLL